MQEVVYGDIYFLINFAFDFLIILLLSRVTGKGTTLCRCILSSVIGGIYAVVSLFMPNGNLLYYISAVLFSLLLVLTAFKKESLHSYIKLTMYYIAISFILGGAFSFVYTVLFSYSSKPFLSVSPKAFLIAAALSGIITLTSASLFSHQDISYETKATLFCEGKKRECNAYLDSGNFLSEPISGKGCAVVSKEVYRAFCPKKQVRVIPTNTEGLLYGYPARIELSRVVRNKERTVSKDIYIVYIKEKDPISQGYDVILPANIFRNT